jgi:hypothetical protein
MEIVVLLAAESDVQAAFNRFEGHMTVGKASIYGRFVADFLARLPATPGVSQGELPPAVEHL